MHPGAGEEGGTTEGRCPLENSRLIMQRQYKKPTPEQSCQASRGRGACRRQPGGPSRLHNQRGAQAVKRGSSFPFHALIWAENFGSGKLEPESLGLRCCKHNCCESASPDFFCIFFSVMDFILPPSPAGGIQWEKVLPPLLPQLKGTCGQYKWSPSLLLPESDNSNSAGVGHLESFCKTK